MSRSRCRGVSLLELLCAASCIVLVAALVVVPGYRSYAHARAAHDAAVTLAQDLALLEHAAKDGSYGEGASLIVVSANPFVYRCYRGRPSSVDPNSYLRAEMVERRFSDVGLTEGPITVGTPLLFASNGSAQYVTGTVIASQHADIQFQLRSTTRGRVEIVTLNLLTGAIATP